MAKSGTGKTRSKSKKAVAKRDGSTAAGGRGASSTKASAKKSSKASPKRAKTKKTTKVAKAASAKKAAAKKAPAKKATKAVKKTSRKATKTTAAANKAKKAVAKRSARTKPASRSTNHRPVQPSLNATSQDPIQFPEERPLTKTHLSEKHLAAFKESLLTKRAEITGDVIGLTRGAFRNGGEVDSSHMPIHMADIGSDNWEQEFTLGLLANEKTRLKEIDAALARIDDGTYGVCLATHKPITLARLRAKPWAKYCIEYARQRDEGLAR